MNLKTTRSRRRPSINEKSAFYYPLDTVRLDAATPVMPRTTSATASGATRAIAVRHRATVKRRSRVCAVRTRGRDARTRAIGDPQQREEVSSDDADVGADAGERRRTRDATSSSIDALSSVLGESIDEGLGVDVEEEEAKRQSEERRRREEEAKRALLDTASTTTMKTTTNDAVETDDGKEEKPLSSPEDKKWREFLSLLVAVGGVKGTVAVSLAAALGLNLFSGDIGSVGFDDAASTASLANELALGLALATPTAIFDAVVMGVDWTRRAEAMNEREGTEDADGGHALERYYEPLSRYQQEETLANPCRSMPAWMDASVALVGRVADEMLERGVALGIGAKWLTDRAVEAGAEPYDAATPAKMLALALAYGVLELRLRRAVRRTRVQAYRVERDRVTGKQTLVPVNQDELSGDRGAKGPFARIKSAFTKAKLPTDDVPAPATKGKTSKPANKSEAQALENIVRGKSVKDNLDIGRSRLLFASQSLAFIATGNLCAPIFGGYVADVLYIAHQRGAMRRFIRRALGPGAPELTAPPDSDLIRKAQTAALTAMIRRKKERMGRDVLDAMERDPSVSREVNIMFQDVVRRAKRVKKLDETSAVDEVLLFINDETNGDENDDVDASDPDAAYAKKMRSALEKFSARLDEYESIAESNADAPSAEEDKEEER